MNAKKFWRSRGGEDGGEAADIMDSSGCSRSFVYDEVAKNQTIHLTFYKCTEGICGRRHDGLTSQIERGIQHHRNAGRILEAFDQPVITGIFIAENSLQPGRS